MGVRTNWIRGGTAVALATASILYCWPRSANDHRMETATIVKAANEFLSTLSEDQRKKELFAFDDAEQRTRWSNLPIPSVPRAGLSLRELNHTQEAALMKLLGVALSKRGLEKVKQIIQSEEVLLETTGAKDAYGGDLYFVSILGTPSTSTPWMLQFGGHHLGINVTIAGEAGILTPTLTGAHPALFTIAGRAIRPLGEESDRGLALMASLDEKQRTKSILNYRVGDVVLGPGQDGKTIVPEGLKASEMTAKQKDLLLDVIGAWSGIINDADAEERMKEIREGLEETWFAWSGPTTGTPGKNIAAYYRIQGPKVVIEFAPQGSDGNTTNHIHTIYRDPTNDYGRAVIK
jgi:hypothetical protein